MKILLIGYSKIAQKRILPALARLNISHIDVASRTGATKVRLPEGTRGQIFQDYEAALSQSPADLVYISLTNDAHAEWTERALERGFHVIVDKPAFTSLDDTRRLIDLAQKQHCCLAEATTYAYHPQIQAAQQAFLEADSQPTRLIATFSFPPLPAGNFRHKQRLGGGALWDLGSYAVTPGRLFFGQAPQQIFCHIGDWGDEVELSFSMLATYSEGRSMVGHFGFNTGYRNQLDIFGPQTTVTIDRVFTTPADMVNALQINQHNRAKTVNIPAADQFALFCQTVIQAIETGQYEPLAETILADATVLDRLRQVSQRPSEVFNESICRGQEDSEQ